VTEGMDVVSKIYGEYGDALNSVVMGRIRAHPEEGNAY